MGQIYLCRHGETEWSLSGQHTSATDLPLTKRGEEQALLLRKRLEDVRFEKVFTSPLKRAMETCKGLGGVADEDLVEWKYGDYEGLTTKEICGKEPEWDLFAEGAPNGESPKEVAKRADRFLKKVSGCKGNVAVFSHGHFLRVLATRFLSWDVDKARSFLVSTASVSILGYERRQPVVILWNSRGGDDQMHEKG